MKRIFSLLASVLLVLSLLAGCSTGGTAGADQEDASSVVVSGATPTASIANVGDTQEVLAAAAELVSQNEAGEIVVAHKYGQTVITEPPERIVSIKLEDLMLALEVDMVACRNFEGLYIEDQINALNIGTIEVDEEANTINLEQVLSYQPDLIVIRDSFDQSIYEELSKIAPTIAFRLQDAEVALVALGQALGMEEAAVARLEAYYEKVDAAKEALANRAGEEVAMLRIMPKEIRLYPYSKNDMSSFLYAYLGLTPSPMVVEYDTADSLAISMETLPDLTAEHIILIAGYGTAAAEAVAQAQERYATIKTDPLWQTVPAVVNGNIYEVDSRVWLTHGLIATEMKIDDVLHYLSA